MNARLAACLAALALPGCAGFGPGEGDGCDWIILQAYPAIVANTTLELHVWARNCGDEPLPIGGDDCVPNREAYPSTAIGNATYALGTGSAVPREDLPCFPGSSRVPLVPPGAETGAHGGWNGTYVVDGRTLRAPPGTYTIRAEVLRHLDVVEVTLRDDGVFDGGRT